MIRIISSVDGFRRCGIEHTKEAVEYADDFFTKDQLKTLQAEPMLMVSMVGAPAANNRPNAKDSIAAVILAATVADLDKLAEGEDRASVIAAIVKRRTELEAPKE